MLINNPNSKATQTAHQTFISKVERAKYRDMSDELKRAITLPHYIEILNYVSLASPAQGLDENHVNYIYEISQLENGISVRLDKNKTGLANTCTVFKTKDGTYMLFIETKGKTYNGLSDPQVIVRTGANKKGLPAFQVISEDGVGVQVPRQYIDLVVKGQGDDFYDTYLELEDEAAATLNYPESVAPLLLSAPYPKQVNGKDYLKAAAFSPLGRPLNEVIKCESLSIDQKEKIILGLLTALSKMHENNTVHQDIKPENIILDEHNEPRFIDLGLSRQSGDSSAYALATAGYQSPEITYAYSWSKKEQELGSPELEYYIYFQHDCAQNSLAALATYQSPYQGTDKDLHKIPDFANDIWALGIVIFELKYSQKPEPGNIELILNDDLLSGMLAPNRADRINIIQALNRQQEIMRSTPSLTA